LRQPCERPASERPERPHATVEQVAAIAARMRRPIDALMVVTAAYTGMRWGELAGLDPDNVDLDKATIYVHADVGALHEVGGKLFLDPPRPPTRSGTSRYRRSWSTNSPKP
jgi:integrase